MQAMRRLALLTCIVAACVPASAASAAITTTTIEYGPYTIPAGEGEPHNHHTAGMIENKIETNVAKPCTNCTLIGVTPDLVYTDGSEANLETGPMLHHAMFAASGGGKSDVTCAGKGPGLLGERFFASGNERTAIDLTEFDYGYKIGSSESWNTVIELMNWETEAKTVKLKMTYEYATGADHSSREALRPVWLDVAQCSLTSHYSVPSGEESDTHYNWKASFGGELIAAAGHIHDHGVNIELTNESDKGSLLCDSVAGYGGEGYETPDERLHVSSMSLCTGEPVDTFSKNDTLRLHSIYDVPEGHHEIDDAMGIMIAYVDQN
jgi:hypothetical protein